MLSDAFVEASVRGCLALTVSPGAPCSAFVKAIVAEHDASA